jgi:hypothetical protein
MQGPKTVQEAIDQFMAAGSPAKAELIRGLDDWETFALLVDRLPHAIETGCAGRVIVLLKMWGAWHDLYPMDRAIQALLQARAQREGTVGVAPPLGREA